MKRAAGLVPLLLLAAIEAPASATTVQFADEPSLGAPVVRVTAGEAEINSVSVSEEPISNRRSRITVRETSAPLVAGQGCTAVDAQTVQCETVRPGQQAQVHVTLGDQADQAQLAAGFDLSRLALFVDAGLGQDVVHSDAQAFVINGGPDADRLTGGPERQGFFGGGGDDVIHGGGSDDYMRGDAGDDELHGGPGDDTLEGGLVEPDELLGRDRFYGEDGDDRIGDNDSGNGQIGPDLLDGGAGSDSVESYWDARAPVTVDLGRKTGQGHAGENDTLIDMENARGGAAADTLLGNDEPNRIDQAQGDDVVAGRGGDDALDVSGAGHVSGGAGDDQIRMWPAYSGSVRCDSGRDLIRFGPYFGGPFPGFPDPRARGMLIGRDCERMRYRTFELAPIPARKRRRLTFRFSSFTCCRKPLALSVASSGKELGTRPIRSVRVQFRHPRRRRSATLRAVFRPRSDIPIVWRFRR